MAFKKYAEKKGLSFVHAHALQDLGCRIDKNPSADSYREVAKPRPNTHSHICVSLSLSQSSGDSPVDLRAVAKGYLQREKYRPKPEVPGGFFLSQTLLGLKILPLAPNGCLHWSGPPLGGKQCICFHTRFVFWCPSRPSVILPTVCTVSMALLQWQVSSSP